MTPKIEKIGYERIVVASGSICQNAAIPGVKKHAYTMDLDVKKEIGRASCRERV